MKQTNDLELNLEIEFEERQAAKSSLQHYSFDDYELELEHEPQEDTLLLRGRLSTKENNTEVTLIEHHVVSTMDKILELTSEGVFSARLRKNDDYVLRFLTDDETYSIPITL